MNGKVRLEGSKELAAYLQTASKFVRSQVDNELGEIAAELEGDMVLSIQQGPKTGRVYRRGGVVHQASAENETPASDTGALIGSIKHEKERDLNWVVNIRALHGLFLEYGTKNMGQRPFVRPAVERATPEFMPRIEAAIARGLGE